MDSAITIEKLHEHIGNARDLREYLSTDPHRPRYHLLPPDGFFNDANCTIFWNGRHHVFYLGRMPNPNGGEWLPVLDHSSSCDLVHWIHHPPAIKPATDGSMPRGIYSGDAIENAPIPTMIYHVPNQGTCIATSEDPDLIHWTPSPENPVIPIPDEPQEYHVFDPCAWYENGTYYALIGNKNSRPGYEGDATSLFRSEDCIHWEYRGPFYKSSRRWTDEVEDCACPDFFSLGDKYMLLMHGHRPYGMAHYYLGRYEDEQFYPETHGRMNWQGGQLSGPESLLDDQGRRIFFGWIREARPWEQYGWASVMTLPRLLSLNEDGSLRIEPVPELEKLRTKHYHQETIQLKAEAERNIAGVKGDCLELKVEIDPHGGIEKYKAKTNCGLIPQFGVKIRQSPDGEEETAIVYLPTTEILKIDLTKSTLDDEVKYPRLTPQDEDSGEKYTNSQEAPFKLAEGEPLKLHIFLDRSVVEVFVNSRLCLTQRIYPTRADSLSVSILASGGEAILNSLDAWTMTPTGG